MAMDFHIGTSGYSYKEWKGTFYPGDLPADRMLGFYSGRFNAVEINNTFYRMPRSSVMEQWREQVPDPFRFVLKTPQRITHRKKLEDIGSDFNYFLETARVLGDRLGPLLVQLPPWQRKDIEKLRALLALVPRDIRVALEVRHASWVDEEVTGVLRDANVALCVSDTEELERPADIVDSATWGYLRLRRCDYDETSLRAWLERIRGYEWRDVWVFFKHEDEGRGPDFARDFASLVS